MACTDIWTNVNNGTLFCAPTAAQRGEFVSCAVQRMCDNMKAAGAPCTGWDKILFELIAALGFESRVLLADCSNQVAPGGAGQPCAPGTPCCAQCQNPLQCANGTCCPPPPFPALGQQALPGCPCAQGLVRNPGTGTCCPQNQSVGSPCSPGCPCPAPMQCTNGQCCWPLDASLPIGLPHNDITKQVWNPKGTPGPLYLDFKGIAGGTTESHIPCTANGPCTGCPPGETCRKMVRALDWELSKIQSWVGASPEHVAELCSKPNGCVYACMCGSQSTGTPCP